MIDLDSKYLVIEGGKALNGEVTISGAKNSALKQIAAALLLPKGTIKINNVPHLSDIEHMAEIVQLLGGEADLEGNSITINSEDLSSSYVPLRLASKLRASFVCLGALVGRFKEARIALPGGCNIGARKVDLHLKGLKALGCEITEEQGHVVAKADRLIGTKIYFDIPSNGATENIMIAATMAEGETIIENAAQDPEIIDLANFLNKMGCDIKGAGTSNIHIQGVKPESLTGFEHHTIPDRIEAATYLIAGIMTKGKIKAKAVIEEDIQSLLSKLEDVGASIKIHNSNTFVDGRELVDISVELKTEKPLATDITTVWYPGFSTDIQPIFSTLLAVSEGTSVVVENIYDSRYQHFEELKRMGAKIEINGKVAVVKGCSKLVSTAIEGKDLRSTAALVVAALAAEGKSEVRGLQHLDRGYENLEDKFIALGASIKRVDTGSTILAPEKHEQHIDL
ncbi:MAG: UDP-N-acetylglucosamine 1-carboxyvinyltransferase [Candidatus Melainabacteria bacterium]|jgi:UDP-N-acetylglucosamine 1-carboxyvinyltransferase|nr:UDP-N-acetylglucosamine 1-carboxyvinyltransferase [Candidatus Melainabacteria bacterium]